MTVRLTKCAGCLKWIDANVRIPLCPPCFRRRQEKEARIFGRLRTKRRSG